MITRAKILVVRASGVRRLLTFLSQMRRLFEGGAYSRAALNQGRRLIEGGAYSSKYGIHSFVSSVGSIKSLDIH